MICAYCHEIIIPDIQAQSIVEEMPEYPVVHSHPCHELIREEIRQGDLARVSTKISAAVLFIVLFAAVAFSQERTVVNLKDAKKGCTHVVGMTSLSVYYEKVLVVAKKPNLNEDGNPQDEYWVVFVEREQNKTVQDGKVYLKPENVPGEQVLFQNPKDGPVMVMHHMKVCKCPGFFWGAASSNISAEH